MQTHLGFDPFQSLRQQVCRSHPQLDRPERVLDGLASNSHRIRKVIQARLHGFEYGLALPTRNASLFALRAFLLDGAIMAV